MNITRGWNFRRMMSLLRSSVSRSNETRSGRISVPLGQHARLTNLQIWPRRLCVLCGKSLIDQPSKTRRWRSRLGLRGEEPAWQIDVPARVDVSVPRARPRPPRLIDCIGMLRSGRRSQGGCLQADEGRRDDGNNRAGLRSSLDRGERGRQPLHLGEEEKEGGGHVGH